MSVAFDTGGAAAVTPWIRPAVPIDIPPRLQAIMGLTKEECARANAPTYPCLIDERHVVAELYGMTNVPMAVWIAEDGRIVRPAEPAGASDGFRAMDRTTFRMPEDVAERGRAARRRYRDAIRDWVANGDASRYVLSAQEVQERLAGPSETDVLAAANFRLGQYLFERGYADDAQRYFAEARRLCPESWHYLRQALDLRQTGAASGPEFYAAVDALGSRPYYPPVTLER